MTEALRFWALMELIGLGATPLAGVLLARVPGAGLALGKVLGLLLVAWLVWLGGATTLVPYGAGSAALWIALVCALGLLAFVREWEGRRAVARGEPRGWLARRRWRRLAARAPAPDRLRTRLFWSAEAVFALAFAAGTLLTAFAPDVWSTEKPMDMAFLNAVNRSDTFPPEDPWLAGADLNYYYLGQLAMALPVKLTGVAPDHGYNLAVGLLLALTATAVFGFAATLWAALRGPGGAVRAGLAAVGLIVVAGTADGLRLAFADGPYDWFGAARVIDDAITEFPAFSFLLGDLHAHVLVLPFTVLVLAFALQLALAGPRSAPRLRALLELLAVALALGMLYAINAWSYPVLAAVLALAAIAWLRDPASAAGRAGTVRWLLAALALSVLLMLPFHLAFDPAARGVGVVEDDAALAPWLRDRVLVYGTLAVFVAVAYARLLTATRRPLRNAVWIAVAALFAGSLLAAVGYAHVGLLAAALALALGAATSSRLDGAERALWVLVAAGVACLLGPELLYVRDEFDGSPLYRMNTIFKLGYQAWLLLGLAGIAALARWRAALPRRGARLLAIVLVACAAVAGLAYPVLGSDARTAGFARAPTLDGLGWLRDRAPGDVAAIRWLDDHAPDGAVVLEAVGEDYSPFGHARISTFTGLPAVLGWPGHERQWEHDVGSRAADVTQLYRTPSPAQARALLERYDVRYVVVGPLERTDHGDAGVVKWDVIGRRVLDRAGTVVWDVQAP